MSVNSDFKAIWNIEGKHSTGFSQRKAFYMKRIPESSSMRKKTVDLDINITCRNGHRKFMQSIRIMNRSPTKYGSGTSSSSSDEHYQIPTEMV